MKSSWSILWFQQTFKKKKFQSGFQPVGGRSFAGSDFLRTDESNNAESRECRHRPEHICQGNQLDFQVDQSQSGEFSVSSILCFKLLILASDNSMPFPSLYCYELIFEIFWLIIHFETYHDSEFSITFKFREWENRYIIIQC